MRPLLHRHRRRRRVPGLLGRAGRANLVTGIPIHPSSARRRTPRVPPAPGPGRRSAGHRADGRRLRHGTGREDLCGAPGGRAPLEVVVVAGRNEPVKPGWNRSRCPQRHRVQILGFTRADRRTDGRGRHRDLQAGRADHFEVLARGAAHARLPIRCRARKPATAISFWRTGPA